jgi:hypothetical protein
LRQTLIALGAALILATSPAVTSAQVGCALVFDAIIAAVSPEIVGDCNGAPATATNGDLWQTTTHGVLMRRAADGVSTFTGDTTTWLDGPEGIQSRPNAERLPWEPLVDAAVTGEPVLPAVPSVPSAPVPKPAPNLGQRCSEILASTPNRGGPTIDQQWGICMNLGEEYGPAGVECYAMATKKNANLIGRISTQTYNDLFNANLDICRATMR